LWSILLDFDRHFLLDFPFILLDLFSLNFHWFRFFCFWLCVSFLCSLLLIRSLGLL
jgi:hypothetical protein